MAQILEKALERIPRRGIVCSMEPKAGASEIPEACQSELPVSGTVFSYRESSKLGRSGDMG
jgi:hypothetical protein